MAVCTFNSTSIPLKEIPVEGVEFAIDAYNADVSGCEDLVAAVSGKYHYIRRITINVAGIEGNVTVTVGSGNAGAAVTSIMIGPLNISKEVEVGTAANEEHFAPSRTFTFEYDRGRNMGRKLTVSEALAIDTSAAVPIHVWVEGKTCAT